jgi:sugar lactone lactonase YvrE
MEKIPMKKRLYVSVLATSLIVSGGLGLSSSVSASYTKTVLAEGADISGGVNGITIDKSDPLNNQLYAASFFGGKIYRIDRENGDILEEFGSEMGVEMPDDLIVGPDGSLYWTEVWTGEVGRLSADRSTWTIQFVVPFVNPITFPDFNNVCLLYEGCLFVAADIFNSGVYEVDPDLLGPPRLIDGLENVSLNGMDFGLDGLLYGPVPMESKLISVDVVQGTTALITDEGIPGPAAVRFDSQGEMFLVDAISGEVLHIDTQTGEKELITQLSHGLDQLAFDSNDRLFVSNANDGSITEVLPNGDTRIVTEPGMITPGGIAVLPRIGGIEVVDVSVFVADSFSIREFDGETGAPIPNGVEWIFENGFLGSMTASADGNNLLLSSWLLNSVQVLNWNSNPREVVKEYLDFATPINAIRFQGNLVVTEVGSDLQTPRVILVTPTDERTTLADATDGLVVPAGLAAENGDLWVSDQATGKILQIIDDGVPLSSPIVVAENLSSPEGIAVYPGGKLLVVEAGANRLSSIRIKNGQVKTIATELGLGREGVSTAPPTFIFNGVAVSGSIIYVTAEIANVVYRIIP